MSQHEGNEILEYPFCSFICASSLNKVYVIYLFVYFAYCTQYDLEPDGKIRFKIRFKEQYGGKKLI